MSDVLGSVRLSGASFFVWDVGWPFATPIPSGDRIARVLLPAAQQIVSYHVVVEGRCWGTLPGETPAALAAGDVLLIPRGDPYVMSSSDSVRAPSRRELEAALSFFRSLAAGDLPTLIADGGPGPERTRVVCGFLGCDLTPFNPVLAALPPLVRLPPPADQRNDRLRALIDYALSETREARAGGRCVLTRLSELMFVEVLRRALLELPAGRAGWLAAMREPAIGRALSLLHRRPADPWTVEKLAEEIRLSRSQLAQRFAELVGEPPIQYLTRWRLQLAARMLADGGAKVSTVAARVGYESAAAFSRAFKRSVGVAPAGWRRMAVRLRTQGDDR